MDEQTQLVGLPGTADACDLAAAEDQGELFSEWRPAQVGTEEQQPSEGQYETLGHPVRQPTIDLPQPLLSSCACIRTESRNFFGGACLPNLDAAERSRFFENCLSAQENERLKLGRELHDSTGQLLLALRLEIAQLRDVRGTAAEGQLLDEIEETVREIDSEIRAFAFAHYPAEIGREGLGSALRSLARGFANRTGLRIRFSSIPDQTTKSGDVALALLRVAQEALLNVHRHARAIHVEVSLALRNDMLELTVRDDGIGIKSGHALEESHGVGVQGMRHRVERLGGHFSIKRLKRGTRIVAAIPV